MHNFVDIDIKEDFKYKTIEQDNGTNQSGRKREAYKTLKATTTTAFHM